MKIFEQLDKENFILYAAKAYNNPQCLDIAEFYEDINRFKYIKKLLGRYHRNGDLQERLILNHLIVIYNVFGIESANHMIKYQINDEMLSYIKTFLIFLNYLSEEDMIEIPLDNEIIKRLRSI